MTNRSEDTKLAVLEQAISNLEKTFDIKTSDIKEDVKEVKSMVQEKIATKEYVDDKIAPLRTQVKWLYGILGGIIVSCTALIIGLVVNK